MTKLDRKIFSNNLKKIGGALFLDLITYIGSITTICSVYFSNNEFSSENIADWGIILFSLFVFIVWIFRFINLLAKERQISLERSDFFEYVLREKKKATNSIINIAGDISWLIDEKESFQNLKQQKPGLDIQIYFDKEKIAQNKETYEMIEEYKRFGIKIKEYPFNNIPHLKALLIDENSDDTKLLVFRKVDTQYKIDFFSKSDVALNFAIAFLYSIKSHKKHLLLGISGLNNIGKSTLVSFLKNRYNGDLSIVPDTFKHESTSTFETAALALCHQIALYNNLIKTNNSKIILFDRTPIDNLAFMLLKMQSNSSYKDYVNGLTDTVNGFMSQFDFIALLKPSDTGFRYTNTTHLDSKTRKKVRKRIEMLYNESHAKVMSYKVSTNSGNFKPRLEEINSDIASRIKRKIEDL